MKLEPVINEPRNVPQRVSFTAEHAMIHLADGRIIGVPLDFFPLLKAATDEERQNYQLNRFSVDWEGIDDGIDITAMLTGLYIEPQKEYLASLEAMIAERYAQVT